MWRQPIQVSYLTFARRCSRIYVSFEAFNWLVLNPKANKRVLRGYVYFIFSVTTNTILLLFIYYFLFFTGTYMATGTVKWFNSTKGFGFINPDDKSSDVFVHISTVEQSGINNLAEGQRLSYDIVNNRGRNAAANLELID